MEKLKPNPDWQTVLRPGYQGKAKDEQVATWNERYGKENWRMAWELRSGVLFSYDEMFYSIYVPGYVKYFLDHPDEAAELTDHFAYAIDKDMISRYEAFDHRALYDKPGRPNQFHNVALNIALEYYLGLPFQGSQPIQVREGKPGSDPSTWPKGWYWSPGRIDAVRQDLIPQTDIKGWWQPGTIEDVYQTAKVLQVRK